MYRGVRAPSVMTGICSIHTRRHTGKKKGTKILLFRTKHKSILTFYIPIYVSNMYFFACFSCFCSVKHTHTHTHILGIYPILYVHRLSHIITHVSIPGSLEISEQEFCTRYLLLDSFFFFNPTFWV